MKPHHLLSLVLFLAALGLSLFLGHRAGMARGQAVTAARLAALPRPAAPPPLSVAPAAPAPAEKRDRSRAELAAFIEAIKGRVLQAGNSTGLVMGFNDTSVREELDTLTAGEIKVAMDLANERPQGLEQAGLSMALLGQWGRLAPAAAYAYASSQPQGTGPMANLWMNVLFPVWANSDPQAAARALAETLKGKPDQLTLGMSGNIVFQVAEKLANTNLPAAMQFVGSLPESSRPLAVTAIAKQAHEAGRQKLFDAIAALPKGEDKTDWQHAAATALAPVDATASAAYIDGLGLDQEDTRQATRTVFEKWKNHDPRAATAWAMSRLPGPEKEVLIDHAVQSWARSEPNECARWLGEFPAGDPLLDHAIATFARSVGKKDPESAREWAARITAGPLREETLGKLPPAKQ